MDLYGCSGVWSGGVVRLFWGVYRGDDLVWAGGLGLLEVFVVPGELKKVSFLPRRLTILKISDTKP